MRSHSLTKKFCAAALAAFSVMPRVHADQPSVFPEARLDTAQVTVTGTQKRLNDEHDIARIREKLAMSRRDLKPGDQVGSLVVDVTSVGWLDKGRLLLVRANGGRVAVVFGGATLDTGDKCPLIDMADKSLDKSREDLDDSHLVRRYIAVMSPVQADDFMARSCAVIAVPGPPRPLRSQSNSP